ncbi:MAG TPA: helix-turn-helix domain-containing protein [Miltoncostaeaceae bacterium]|jgi:DNA-binding IclR family transcriptional regulator|nr:helix-turn-helix domain-containing protein [Miltoncostaeaceae bacterium]
MSTAGGGAPGGPITPAVRPGWTFLTNHAHVMVALTRDPQMRMRDLAALVGITERATQRIVGELVEHGYLERERVGRRNSYRINLDLPLRHPLEGHHSLRQLLSSLAQPMPPPREG